MFIWMEIFDTNRRRCGDILRIRTSANLHRILPRHAIRQRGTILYCRPVSVRLSVTLGYCIQMAKDIVNLSRSGSPTGLVSWGHLVLSNSKGLRESPQWGR